MAIPVVLDVDTGTDDAAALLWAATDPAIELVAAMATWGNTTVEQAARNTRAVLNAAGRTDVPVFVGEDLEAMEETRGIPANRWDIAGTVDADAFRGGVRAWLGAP
jgi:pyrimidine-specific ribonucleoside hydrolase